MTDGISGVWEIVLIFGAVLGLAVYELWSLRRLRRRREAAERRERTRP